MKTLSSSLSLESQTGADKFGPTSILWSVVRTDIVQLEEDDLVRKGDVNFERVKALQEAGKTLQEVLRSTGLGVRVARRFMEMDKYERDEAALEPFARRTVVHADLPLLEANERLLSEQAK